MRAGPLVVYGGLMDSIDVLRDWLEALPPGTRIQSPAFEGDTFVQQAAGWNRGRGWIGSITLLSFSLRWAVVSDG